MFCWTTQVSRTQVRVVESVLVSLQTVRKASNALLMVRLRVGHEIHAGLPVQWVALRNVCGRLKYVW